MNNQSIEMVLTSIQPGLTVYGILVTFAVASFYVFKWFIFFEKTIQDKYLDKLSNLKSDFRRVNIESLLSKKISSFVLQAYDKSIKNLILDLKADPDKKDELISEFSLNERLSHLKDDDTIETFFYENDGSAFLDKLDQLYEQLHKFEKTYRLISNSCFKIAYSALALFFIFLTGLLKTIISIPEMFRYLWIFILSAIILHLVIHFVIFEYNRRRYWHIWEKFRLYGQT